MILTACLVTLLAPGPPEPLSVRAFGAVGDGRTDDTAAFQRAVAAAAEQGATVWIEPVAPGGGYVLTETIRLEPGVSLVGAPFGMPNFAWEGVRREVQRGAVILARPRPEGYQGERKQPLFDLGGGNTVRGLYILYDEQPWPSDAEFQNPASPYYYPDLESAKARFLAEHARPYGPTFFSRHGASTTIEDITCGRYWDFIQFQVAGKVFIERCYLFGYKRAIAIRHGPDTIRIRGIHVVPNVERPIAREHTWLHAAICAAPDNIAFDFGAVDGYSLDDVVVFLAHTGLKLGASEEDPFLDRVSGEREALSWGRGPWGSIQNFKLDNVVLGIRAVTATILPNQINNAMIHVSLPPTARFGPGADAPARQAAVAVEPGFAGGTLQIHNLSLSSFAPTGVLAGATMVHQAGGRAFLLDCPGLDERRDYADRRQAHLEIFGLVISNIAREHWVAATPGTRARVVARGFVHNGVAVPDGALYDIPAMR